MFEGTYGAKNIGLTFIAVDRKIARWISFTENHRKISNTKENKLKII